MITTPSESEIQSQSENESESGNESESESENRREGEGSMLCPFQNLAVYSGYSGLYSLRAITAFV